MQTDLFRDEVLASRRAEWLGSVSLPSPRLGWFLSGFSLLTVIGIVVLLFCGHYTRHEQVAGFLVPSSGLLTLTPVLPGVVERVLVQEGSKVQAGQPLIVISGEQDSAALGSTQAAISMQLQVKRKRLEDDASDLKNLTQLQQLDFQNRLAAMQAQISQLDDLVAIGVQRANSALALSNEWSKYVSTGVVSRLQLLQQKDAAAQAQAQLKELQVRRLQLQQQVGDLRGQLKQLPVLEASKQNDISRQLADIALSFSQNAAQRAIVLRAPADGAVVNILVHPGQSVVTQQSTVTVLPATSNLLAELWIPPRAIGFIHTGEAVVIRYEAYPYQKFGQHLGHISEVSRSALSPAEVSQLIGQKVEDPRYRVQIALDAQEVIAYGKPEVLKPGMTLEADVQLDRRRLIEWVLEPLMGLTAPMHGQSINAQKNTHG